MIQEQVRSISNQLRLNGIHSNFEARSSEAMAKGLQPLEFLLLLLQDEVLQRKNRLAKSLVTRAKFRLEFDLEDWDSSFDRGVSKAKMRELSCLSFFKVKENLLICGRTGEG